MFIYTISFSRFLRLFFRFNVYKLLAEPISDGSILSVNFVLEDNGLVRSLRYAFTSQIFDKPPESIVIINRLWRFT